MIDYGTNGTDEPNDGLFVMWPFRLRCKSFCFLIVLTIVFFRSMLALTGITTNDINDEDGDEGECRRRRQRKERCRQGLETQMVCFLFYFIHILLKALTYRP